MKSRNDPCRERPRTICDNFQTSRREDHPWSKGGTLMIDPETIAKAKRALGRQLAAYRDAAGLNQHQLAPLVHYGRSTGANVETGRQTCARTFWERCDRTLAAGGILLQAHEELVALIRRQRADSARRREGGHAAADRHGLPDRVTVTSPAHLDEILVHLRDQWHAQVKTDNLL